MVESIERAYYQKIKESVDKIEGLNSKELLKYNTVYDKELERYTFKKSTSSQFFKKIRNAQIILVGDFHAQSQSARSFLRICRHVQKKESQKMVLVLECFEEKHQSTIDEYLSQKINESSFLKKIEWSKNWSFSWDTTRPLMKWAMQNNVPVYGLNQFRRNIKLSDRDKCFAKCIHKVQMLHKTSKILVQVGDFHLAEKHLPLELSKFKNKSSIFKIFQSPDAIYFKSLENSNRRLKHHLEGTDFYQLSEKAWALMTVLPWVKWQDYLLHLESRYDSSLNDIDFTDHVDRFVGFVTNMLNLRVNHERLSVYWAYDSQVKKLMSRLDPKTKRIIQNKINSNQSFFIPELQVGILSQLTVNHLSKIAGQYILYEVHLYKRTFTSYKTDFLQMIWFEACSYFLSKLANSKRKTDTLNDIKNSLKNISSSDLKREALILSLKQKMKEMHYQSSRGKMIERRMVRFSLQSYETASQLLGGMLGEKIFNAFHQKVLKLEQFKTFLLHDFNNSHFEKNYYELIEIIDSWPILFNSKYDRF